jgi:hypothetical protein
MNPEQEQNYSFVYSKTKASQDKFGSLASWTLNMRQNYSFVYSKTKASQDKFGSLAYGP